ncbi:MAG: phosphotransferase [Steroidobacteraceae bacterium]
MNSQISEREMPVKPEGLIPQFLTPLVSSLHPGLGIREAKVVNVKSYGEANNEASVSTSTQVTLDVRYDRATQLPTRLLVKMSIPEDVLCSNPELGPLFVNEIDFYQRLRPELHLEAPQAMGGYLDPHSRRFVLLMEDLKPKSPHFNSMTDADDVAVVQGVLDTLAKLHATYWETPRFKTDLSWVENQVAGPMEDMFDTFIRQHVVNELKRERYKREFTQELGTNEAEMYFGEKALKRHQATLAQTFLHGDTHFGNTYSLPNKAGGLIDWQVSCRGFLMHDLGYFIQTALSVEGRRKHERELLQFYREKLREHGVKEPPSADLLWLEYRRSALHGFYLGWLTAPRENYGLEVCVIGNHRTKVACADLETMPLIRELL